MDAIPHRSPILTMPGIQARLAIGPPHARGLLDGNSVDAGPGVTSPDGANGLSVSAVLLGAGAPNSVTSSSPRAASALFSTGGVSSRYLMISGVSKTASQEELNAAFNVSLSNAIDRASPS
jgi:hypothetical protein